MLILSITAFNGADPCETNNGNCDYHTKCSLLNGFVQCSACPPGFTGSGQSGCKGIPSLLSSPSPSPFPLTLLLSLPLPYELFTYSLKAQCGDGTCDKNIGEQCVSCPSDCDNVYQNQSCSMSPLLLPFAPSSPLPSRYILYFIL